MKRHGLKILIAAVLIACFAWIASNMSFRQVPVHEPLRGEAARNPFYAAIKLSEALGATATWERVFTAPPDDSVIVISSWNWTLSRARRQLIEHWVEAGGRLVVDQSLIGGFEEFERWSGVSKLKSEKKAHRDADEKAESDEDEDGEFVLPLQDEPCNTLVEDATKRSLSVCGISQRHSLASSRKILWALRDGQKIHVLRTAVGRGSVTVINASPFRHRDLFLGDHPSLFVAVTQLHRGDELLFLTEEDHASMLMLVWRFGAPVVLLACIAIALALWRAGARFGPLNAPSQSARRSLAEQIRGTGQFALRFGGGQSIHAATARALRDAAIRRLPTYDRMASEERIAALAKLTGVNAEELAPALNYSGARNSHELRHAIAIIENTRRRLQIHRRSK
jgi:hypothetical protein